MTKKEFLQNVPFEINHSTNGLSEIEIVADTDSKKGICYRNKDNFASYGTYGNNWKEVKNKLHAILTNEKLI